MKIYIASSFDLIERVEEVCQALESAGHEITVKWWKRIYQTQGLGPVQTTELKKLYNNLSTPDFYSKPETKASYESDRQGIIDADYLVFVADEVPRKYNGANVELGIADALGKPCFSIGRMENSALYYQLIKCFSIPDLLTMIKNSVSAGEKGGVGGCVEAEGEEAMSEPKKLSEKLEEYFRPFYNETEPIPLVEESRGLEQELEDLKDQILQKAESALHSAQETHKEIGELLKFYELNGRWPDDRKLDYNTLLYAWVKFNELEASSGRVEAGGEDEK